LLPEQAFLCEKESLVSQQAFVFSALTCIGTTQQSTYLLKKNCQSLASPLPLDFDFDADADADC